MKIKRIIIDFRDHYQDFPSFEMRVYLEEKVFSINKFFPENQFEGLFDRLIDWGKEAIKKKIKEEKEE